MAKLQLSGVISALSLAMMITPIIGIFCFTIVSEAAIIHGIEVRGNKHVDSKTIRDNIDVKLGEDISGVDIDSATKRLFSMGLFSDVIIRQIDGVLVIYVSEYSIVNQVIFHGNKKIKDADLKRIVSLKPRGGFDPAKKIVDEHAIRDAYIHIGQHGTSVRSKIENLDQGMVNIVFEIEEGKQIKVGDIVFYGNKIFSASRLRDIISTKSSNIFSWLTRSDIYTADRLASDEEKLRSFYRGHGYADFRIISSNVTLNSLSGKHIISFVVDEGQLYRFGDIKIESTIVDFDIKSIGSVLKTRRGDIYNFGNIEDSVLALSDRIADLGFAFARIEPLGDRDFTNRTISITYTIDEGHRTYIERIEIHGNNKTHDQVIRREFDLGEGDAFSQTRVKRASRRLEGLGLFQNVSISTAPGSESDQVILMINVVEKSTGEFSIGGGYTTGGESPGISVETSITERNFLGRNQYLRLGVGGGQQDSRNYSLSFTEPYFFGYRLSSGFDFFHHTYRMNDDYYDVKQTGGIIRFGIPITDELTGNLTYNYVEEEYNLDDDQPDGGHSGAIVEAAKNSPWRRSSVGYGLIYNTIDNMHHPHDGLFIRATQEYAGLGGKAKFLKTSGKAMLYKTISEQCALTGLLGLGSGYIHEIGNGGTRIFDMFRSNFDMIRGFRFNGIGPMQRSSNGHEYFIGGNTYVNATAEVQFPMPVVASNFGMHGAVFVDAATLYGNNYEPSSPNEGQIVNTESIWRTSAGISLMWASPFGPLRFDYAWPLKKADGDQVQNFNFGISTKF